MKKIMCIVIAISMIMIFAAGCGEWETNGAEIDTKKAIEVANTLQSNQPTPTDIDYSLERYNLIRRTYWVNGQREKARIVPCPIADIPLGYVILFTESGDIIGRFVVEGKVTSLNSYLTPDSEYYEKDLGYRSGSEAGAQPSDRYSNKWLADVDGSYGTNDNGIFFFTPDGKYLEWTGTYLYSDIPFEIESSLLKAGD